MALKVLGTTARVLLTVAKRYVDNDVNAEGMIQVEASEPAVPMSAPKTNPPPVTRRNALFHFHAAHFPWQTDQPAPAQQNSGNKKTLGK